MLMKEPTAATTVTLPLTTSSIFACLASPVASPTTTLSTPQFSITAPTSTPLSPAKADAQALIDDFGTAFLYAALIGNGGNLPKLCSALDPAGLRQLTGFSLNGSLIQTEVCAAASLQSFAPELASVVVEINQQAFAYLATALYAVQVAGNYAGGPDLTALCDAVQPAVIEGLFVQGSTNAATQAKDYVCSAAAASTASQSSSSSSTAAPQPTASYNPPPQSSATTNNTTSTGVVPTCTSPLGFANKAVVLPSPLATPSFEVDPAFAAQHLLFLFGELNGRFPRATVATFCLEQCIQYQATNATTMKGPECVSFNVNRGRPIPPELEGGNEPRWFCSGFDEVLGPEVFVKRDVEGAFMYPLGVNRVCGGDGYRDY
ncbi:MAG: hypothetical protein LQ346_008882 [Caloplaca aetnensis]|nr:MAG: hypothetical protein LQ346_008882 [Caloplaca aetnensis]